MEDEWGNSLETLDPIDESNMIGGIRIGTATTVLVRTMCPKHTLIAPTFGLQLVLYLLHLNH